MALPVTELQRLLTLGETELILLDLTINVERHFNIIIGPRYSVNCVYSKTASPNRGQNNCQEQFRIKNS